MALIVHSQNGAMSGAPHGIRTWQSPAPASAVLLLGNPNRVPTAMRLVAPIALVVSATVAGIWGTSALEEQAHDRELFAAYCMGVFGPDQTRLKSLVVPACLTNEPADQCSARIAEIDHGTVSISICGGSRNLWQHRASLCPIVTRCLPSTSSQRRAGKANDNARFLVGIASR
jgi:hypothetical protein